MECIIYSQMCTVLVLKCRSVGVISIFGFFKLFNYRIVLTVKFPVLRGVTSIQFFYLSKSKSNSSQNYSSKSKSTDSKKLLK